jgi:hypothetical protein
MQQQRRVIDPIFQNRIKYRIRGKGGHTLAEVFVLNRSMLPIKQSRKRKKRGKKL